VITAGLLRAAGVTVTGVDIDELDPALITGPGPWHGPEAAQATARIELTAAGTAEPRQITIRIGYALAMAAATGAPARVAGPLLDQLAVRAKDDLVARSPGTCRCHGNGGAAVWRACSPGTRRFAGRLPDGQWASVKPRRACQRRKCSTDFCHAAEKDQGATRSPPG